MNKPSEQTPTSGTARSGDQTQPKGVPPAFDAQRKQDSHEAAPDKAKKPDAGKSSYLPNSGREDKAPLQAARGDDDMMSKKPGKPA
jgi:hypothetical protein